jgi:hypothetical protein
LACPSKEEKSRASEPPSSGGTSPVVTTTRAAGYRAEPVANGKAIEVRVDFATPRPEPSWPIPPMVRSQCGHADHVLNEALSASPDGGANGAVAWLEDIHAGRPLEPIEAVQDEKSCVFSPHILALPAAGTLTLANGDPANHAVRFEFGGDESLDFQKTLPGGGSLTVPIQEDWGGKVARVSCPIHLWMNGYALFFSHPYFAVTKAGAARIEGVPPGTYTLVVWHEGTSSTFDSSIKLAPPQTARIPVKVENEDVKKSFVIAPDGTIAAKG